MSKADLQALIGRIWLGEEPSGLNTEDTVRYHSAKGEDACDPVPDSTWFDLDMDDVFFRINRTCSAVGAQYLYHEMHRYRKDLKFPRRRFLDYRRFQKNQSSSQLFAKILLRLRGRKAAYISAVLFGVLPVKPFYFPVLLLMSFLFAISVAGLIFVSKEFLLGVVGIALLNSLIQHVLSFRIYVPDMGSIGQMLGVAASLADTGETGFRDIEILDKHRKFIKHLQKKFSWILIDSSSLNELAASVISYVNHLLLVNLIVYFSAAKYVKKHKKELIEIFEAIGSLDSSMAVSAYLSSENCCCPELVNENRIEVTSLYHPVLKEPVANSFTLVDHSSLITGSNMAGKTTFIKTIGVNLLLARTLGFCHGESAVFPLASVLSTIRRRDDLQHGKSYYYVEIETILEFIKASDSGDRYLFLIDEIFRGTNTIERLAASSAVLKYLSERGMVLVTTHDIELEHMLNKKFVMYHFQEQIEDGRHFFDYRIKPGPCRSRNAIRLLEITGYPSEITSAAHSISRQLSGEITESS
ncbi:MAG: hypothetical protein U9P42_01105 [Candidatus Fermentibacteria bacterium]|nr:hypothetical protein [Candidatus Fermentibacteria bacterium]